MSSSSNYNPSAETDWTLKYHKEKSSKQISYIQRQRIRLQNLHITVGLKSPMLHRAIAEPITTLFESEIGEMLSWQVPAQYPESGPNALTLPQLIDRQRTYIREQNHKIVALSVNLRDIVQREGFGISGVQPLENALRAAIVAKDGLDRELRDLEANLQEARKIWERRAREASLMEQDRRHGKR